MIVVDTSAIIGSLLGDPPIDTLVQRLSDDGDLHAPHLIDVEVVHALRGLVLRGRVTAERAADALHDFADVAITRYPHEGLRDRMWQLRPNLTAYDAAFVALSEILEAPLVTTDARLSRAPGHSATIEMY